MVVTVDHTDLCSNHSSIVVNQASQNAKEAVNLVAEASKVAATPDTQLGLVDGKVSAVTRHKAKAVIGHILKTIVRSKAVGLVAS